jgi:hypothetical protein
MAPVSSILWPVDLDGSGAVFGYVAALSDNVGERLTVVSDRRSALANGGAIESYSIQGSVPRRRWW